MTNPTHIKYLCPHCERFVDIGPLRANSIRGKDYMPCDYCKGNIETYPILSAYNSANAQPDPAPTHATPAPKLTAAQRKALELLEKGYYISSVTEPPLWSYRETPSSDYKRILHSTVRVLQAKFLVDITPKTSGGIIRSVLTITEQGRAALGIAPEPREPDDEPMPVYNPHEGEGDPEDGWGKCVVCQAWTIDPETERCIHWDKDPFHHEAWYGDDEPDPVEGLKQSFAEAMRGETRPINEVMKELDNADAEPLPFDGGADNIPRRPRWQIEGHQVDMLENIWREDFASDDRKEVEDEMERLYKLWGNVRFDIVDTQPPALTPDPNTPSIVVQPAPSADSDAATFDNLVREYNSNARQLEVWPGTLSEVALKNTAAALCAFVVAHADTIRRAIAGGPTAALAVGDVVVTRREWDGDDKFGKMAFMPGVTVTITRVFDIDGVSAIEVEGWGNSCTMPTEHVALLRRVDGGAV